MPKHVNSSLDVKGTRGGARSEDHPKAAQPGKGDVAGAVGVGVATSLAEVT